MVIQDAPFALHTGQPAGFETATLSQRLFAFLFDALVILCLYFLLFLLVGQVVDLHARWDLLAIALLVAMDVSYYLFCWTRPRGQTLGKLIVNNRVIKLDGSRLTLRDAFLRWIVRDVNTLVLGIGWLVMLGDGQNRGWHDRAAGTLVVLAEPSATADTLPFRPRSVAWGWLMIGIPGAAMMTAINWQRLGKPERYYPTLIVGLAITGVVLTALTHPFMYQLLPAQRQLPVSIALAVGVSLVYGVLISRSQQVDYEAWRNRNGGQHPTPHQAGRKTLGRIVLFSIAANYILSAFLVPAVVAATAPLLPDRQFTDQVITLTYPGSWWTNTTFEDVPFCQQPGMTCLITGGSLAGQTSGQIFELVHMNAWLVTVEAADAQAWAANRERDPAAREVSREVYAIDGYDAVERRFQTGSNTAVVMFIEAGAGLYRFFVQAPTDVFRRDSSTIEHLIARIHLTGRQ